MTTKLIRIITITLAAVFLVASPVFAQGAARPANNDAPDIEEVTSFSSDIVVSEDGTISVTEKIDYNFPDDRHGIFRDIPIRYEMDNGEVVIVPVEIVSVEGGPYKIKKTRSMLRIQIGDPDKTITGMHSYTIKYVASGALRYFDDYDELYWNVTGHEWGVPFRRVTAQVFLPNGVEKESIRMKCYTGPFGSIDDDCLYHRAAAGASFAADDMLTIVVGWGPKGLVAKLEPLHPSFWTDYVQPYGLIVLLMLLLPLGVFVYMFRRWQNHGRDPMGQGTTVVQYDPPDKITPAEVGVLMDERVDIRDVSAVIVDLAVRGYLKIIEQPKQFLLKQDFEFELLKLDYKQHAALLKHEKEILDILFDGRTSVKLNVLVKNHSFHSRLGTINKQLYGRAVDSGYFPESPDKVRKRYQGIGGALMIIGVFLGIILLSSESSELLYGGLMFISVGISGIIVLAFGGAMPKKTSKGIKAYEHAKGFREYLEKAEKYRIQWQEKEHIFEKFLPYAMVFGVADKWSEAFKNIDLPEPDWYQGSAFTAGHFNSGAFLGAIGGLQSGLTRAVSSQPQKSSGGSGFSGGSSGGGFGGGGGGSW